MTTDSSLIEGVYIKKRIDKIYPLFLLPGTLLKIGIARFSVFAMITLIY